MSYGEKRGGVSVDFEVSSLTYLNMITDQLGFSEELSRVSPVQWLKTVT